MLATALWHVWAGVIDEYLPLVPDALGWSAGEETVRSALQRDSPSRSNVIRAASILAVLLLAFTLVVAVAALRLALGWAAAALAFAWKLSAALLRSVVWEPVWWAALPASVVAAVQTAVPLCSHFWFAPAWWWLLSGRTWAVLGSALAVGTKLLLGGPPYWLAIVAWTLLRAAWCFSSLWLRVPAVAIVLAAWAFGFLLWLHALAESSRNGGADGVPQGELSTDVPHDAEGEVARILGCRHYYDVLELDDTHADLDTVRKAHHRKGACCCCADALLLASADTARLRSAAGAPGQVLFAARAAGVSARAGCVPAAQRCASCGCCAWLAASALTLTPVCADHISKREYDTLLAEAAHAREQAAMGRAHGGGSPVSGRASADGGSDSGRGTPRPKAARARKGGVRR
jgi:uncharacterized membrane protein YgcG